MREILFKGKRVETALYVIGIVIMTCILLLIPIIFILKDFGFNNITDLIKYIN